MFGITAKLERDDMDRKEGLTALRDVPSRLQMGVSRRPRWKKCYDAAWQYVVIDHEHEPGIRLVHGTYDPSGMLRSDHAWVEIPNRGHPIVFDGARQRFYDAKAYRKAL